MGGSSPAASTPWTTRRTRATPATIGTTMRRRGRRDDRARHPGRRHHRPGRAGGGDLPLVGLDTSASAMPSARRRSTSLSSRSRRDQPEPGHLPRCPGRETLSPRRSMPVSSSPPRPATSTATSPPNTPPPIPTPSASPPPATRTPRATSATTARRSTSPPPAPASSAPTQTAITLPGAAPAWRRRRFRGRRCSCSVRIRR